MHYRNGREAKNGDKVVSLNGYGLGVVNINSIGILYDAVPTSSVPANRTEPRAAGGATPMIALQSVVLPMPLRPMSVTISPGAMASDMPNKTWLRP